MPANGPWHSPPDQPTDGRRLCIVLVHFGKLNKQEYLLLHWNAPEWRFQDGTRLSRDNYVVRWAYLELEAPGARR
ncbi:MAG: hypothetical protein JNL05_00605 [Flavobacteriales bacterium]|nr:hypothetical protein [Flavobacteriales bacterium]